MKMAITRENVLAALVLVFGAVSAICAFVPEWHVSGSWTGLFGLALGAVAQMMLVLLPLAWTRAGWVLSFIGLALGISNGGLW